MTGLNLDAVEARANAATEGPWTTGAYRRVLPGLATQTGNHAADASFIRHARTDVPEMAAELRLLRVENAELRKVVKAAQEWVEYEGESAHQALADAVDGLTAALNQETQQ